jgi:hypothetical protein
MQVLVALLVGSFVLGGTSLGRWLRERPIVLIPAVCVAAASYYSLGVAL